MRFECAHRSNDQSISIRLVGFFGFPFITGSFTIHRRGKMDIAIRIWCAIQVKYDIQIQFCDFHWKWLITHWNENILDYRANEQTPNKRFQHKCRFHQPISVCQMKTWIWESRSESQRKRRNLIDVQRYSLTRSWIGKLSSVRFMATNFDVISSGPCYINQKPLNLPVSKFD